MSNITKTSSGGGGSSGMVLLRSIAASSSPSIVISSAIALPFTTYLLKIRNLVPATTNTSIIMTFSTDNGVTYLGAGTYYWHKQYANSASNSGATGSEADSSFNLADSLLSSPTFGQNGEVTFFDLNSSTFSPTYLGFFNLQDAANHSLSFRAGGFNTTTTPVNAIKIAMSSGNITSGNFYFYGITEP